MLKSRARRLSTYIGNMSLYQDYGEDADEVRAESKQKQMLWCMLGYKQAPKLSQP